MADSSNTQCNLRSCSKAPTGPTLPPVTEDDHPGHGEQARDNTAALNRLLSPLPIGPSSTTTQRSATTQRPTATQRNLPVATNCATPSQLLPGPSRQIMRPISTWRPVPRPHGHPSPLDAAQAELSGEDPAGGAPAFPDSMSRSNTHSVDDEDDGEDEPPRRSAFFLDGSPSDPGQPEPAAPPPRAPTSVAYTHGE